MLAKNMKLLPFWRQLFNQISDAERNQKADIFIDNSGSIDNLEVLVKKIWRKEIGIL